MKTFTQNKSVRKIVLSFILVMLVCAGAKSQSCQAGFTFSVNNNVVTFTNTSTGSSMPGYYWNFGDGNYSYVTNPTNAYTTVGTFIVCLTMYDSLNFNCSSTFCDTVVITNVPPIPCSAYFYAYPDSLNNTMNFYDASQGTPVAWFWDFGDNTTSTLQNPVHTYTNPGVYYVCMTEYTLIDTCTYCDSIYYYPCNSQASFTINTSNDPTINFTNTSTGGYAPYYYWDFGDGNNSYSQNGTNTYMYNGTYNVCLYMFDSIANCTSYSCSTVTISNGINVPCSANFTAYPDSANTGLVNYTDQSTGGPFYSWFWDFGDGFTSTLQNPTHTYAQTGWYVICLTVFSQTDTCSYCDSIYVLKLAGIHDEQIFNGTINYFPNPSNGITTIAYILNENADVSLEVYDMVGNKVETLLNKSHLNAGSYETKWNAEEKAEGVYFVRITVNGVTATGKLTIMK